MTGNQPAGSNGNDIRKILFPEIQVVLTGSIHQSFFSTSEKWWLLMWKPFLR